MLITTIFESFRLGNWVSKQRTHYNWYMEGKPSQITRSRIDILNDVSFIWDAWQHAFDLRLSQLVEYKETHGDCNVPQGYNDTLE